MKRTTTSWSGNSIVVSIWMLSLSRSFFLGGTRLQHVKHHAEFCHDGVSGGGGSWDDAPATPHIHSYHPVRTLRGMEVCRSELDYWPTRRHVVSPDIVWKDWGFAEGHNGASSEQVNNRYFCACGSRDLFSHAVVVSKRRHIKSACTYIRVTFTLTKSRFAMQQCSNQ